MSEIGKESTSMKQGRKKGSKHKPFCYKASENKRIFRNYLKYLYNIYEIVTF